MALHFGAEATLVDAGQPQLRIASRGDGAGELRRFDLVVGCDGGGSGVRRSIADHTSGFAVEGDDLGNHSLMLHLDQHLDEPDRQYLYVLAVQLVTAVAGAINGPGGPADPRWFCQIGFSGTMRFDSAVDAGHFLDSTHPLLRHFASDAKVEEFSHRLERPVGHARMAADVDQSLVMCLDKFTRVASPGPALGWRPIISYQLALSPPAATDSRKSLQRCPSIPPRCTGFTPWRKPASTGSKTLVQTMSVCPWIPAASSSRTTHFCSPPTN